jgi:hypothetical protein
MQRRTARITGSGCGFREGVAQKTRNRCRRGVRQAYDENPDPSVILLIKQMLIQGSHGFDRRHREKPTIKPFTHGEPSRQPGRRQKQRLFALYWDSPRRVCAAVSLPAPTMKRWTHLSVGPVAGRIACTRNIRARRNFGRRKISTASVSTPLRHQIPSPPLEDFVTVTWMRSRRF